MADVFVDFSASNDGDGTAHSQAASPGGAGAYNTLSGKTFTTGDKVWIRRKTKASQSSTWTISSTGVTFVGWPKSGDRLYSTRPSAAQASWDGDSDDYPIVQFTSSSAHLAVTGADNAFHRIQSENNGTTVTNGSWNVDAGSGVNTFVNCVAKNTAAGDAGQKHVWRLASRVTMFACVAEGCGGPSAASNGAAFLFAHTNASRSFLYGCTAPNTDNKANQSGAYFTAQANQVTLVDCDFGLTNKGVYGYRVEDNVVGLRVFGGEAKATTGISVPTGVASALWFFAIKLTGVDTFVNISQSSTTWAYVSIREGTQATGVTAAVVMWSGILFLGNVTFNAGNTASLSVIEGRVLVLSRNTSYNTTVLASGSLNPPPLNADLGGTLGLFQSNGSRGKVSSSSVVRTGGEVFSLKLESLVAAESHNGADIQLGLPGFETIWVPLVAGSNTVTIYGAHKVWGSDPPTKADVWFELDYLDAGSGAHRECATTRELDVALDSDGSTWTGDSGVTAFKLELTVTAGQDCVAPVRIGFGKYVSGAYVYLDPKPVVS